MDTGLAADGEKLRSSDAPAGGIDTYFEEAYLRFRDRSSTTCAASL